MVGDNQIDFGIIVIAKNRINTIWNYDPNMELIVCFSV